MYIVTGGAGFIGSNLVRGLNKIGITDILVVDNLRRSEKFNNLVDCDFNDYLDKKDFLEAIENEKIPFAKIEAIFHQGACSNTMEGDGQYMMANNFAYSKVLVESAIKNKIPFIYASSASVYGNQNTFIERRQNEKPINVYAFSKFVFDQYVRKVLVNAESSVVGLRYFNVYGPHEAHKGPMASVIFQFYKQLRLTRAIKLFEGTDGCENGEQRRDFVSVEDVVKVNLFFLKSMISKGIFNIGTGKSSSFNQIANCLINLEGYGDKMYIPFPESLRNKYQSYTQADISSLRKAGYDSPFLNIDEGVKLYHSDLKKMALSEVTS